MHAGGDPVGSGHCVALVQHAAGAPATAHWRRGQQVRGNYVERGTVIATFNDAGRYANDTQGGSHAALFLEETEHGLRVIDQWLGRRPEERTIRWKNGVGQAVDDGDRYYVVMV